MHRSSHTFAAAMVVVASALTALTAGGAASASATGAQNYFGWTSKSMPLQLDIHGQLLSKQSFIDGQLWSTCPATMHCLKKRWAGNVITLTPFKDVSFEGDRISYHRAAGGTEWWLEARRRQGGRVISGWIRQSTHWAGYAPSDSGKISFSATLWASSAGSEWSGQTSDGQPLTMSVGYRSVLSDLPFSVTQLSRTLTCSDPGGASSTRQITIPALKGEMSDLYFRGDPKSRFPAHTRSEKPAGGSVTTSDGLSVEVTMAVDKLAPQGKALVATGTLRITGAANGGGQCEPLSTTFELRPQ